MPTIETMTEKLSIHMRTYFDQWAETGMNHVMASWVTEAVALETELARLRELMEKQWVEALWLLDNYPYDYRRFAKPGIWQEWEQRRRDFAAPGQSTEEKP